jgi:small-conductance mechanosensitive channel
VLTSRGPVRHYAGRRMKTLFKDISETLHHVLDYPVFPSSGITVASLLALILLFGLVIVAERIFRRQVVMRMLKRTHLEPALQFTLARVTGYALLALGFYISLQMVGVNLSSLAIIAGAIGVGLGFGLQNIISNFISGLIILAERPIAIGDRVEIGGVSGQVREISLRSTTLATNDNIAIIVPNADFITQRVTNWSYDDPRVRYRIPFGVAYGSDLEKLRRLMLEVAEEHPKSLKDPTPELFFVGFGDSSLNFELGVWSDGVTVAPRRFRSDLLFAIEKKLRENNIEIPFPQRDVRMRSDAPPAPAPPASLRPAERPAS